MIYKIAGMIKVSLGLALITLSLNGCNGAGTTPSSSPTLSLDDYFGQMTYSPLSNDLVNDSNQFVLSLSNNATVTSADINFYQSQNCESDNVQKIITLYPKKSNNKSSSYLLSSGFYISSNKLNYNLCMLYSGTSGYGCYAEYKDIKSIKIIHHYVEPPYITELCISASGAGDLLASHQQTEISSLKQNIVPTNSILNKLQCNDSSCKYSRSYYSSINLTCSNGKIKCGDGSCAASSNSCPNKSICPSNLVECPSDGSSNTTCATDMENCPIVINCPVDKPVKCQDGTCAVSVNKCIITNPFMIYYYRCSNGGWNIFVENCGTDSTCPIEAPIKCKDNSCRKSISDCKSLSKCPEQVPYQCSDGECVADYAQCAKKAKCPANLPVQCQNDTCAKSVVDCPPRN